MSAIRIDDRTYRSPRGTIYRFEQFDDQCSICGTETDEPTVTITRQARTQGTSRGDGRLVTLCASCLAELRDVLA